ncbi:MAG TPA: hypothetical protein VFY29_21150 [Terriglobia bacterium]|nr:hypothetical protein [Terriglobia bacterium]
MRYLRQMRALVSVGIIAATLTGGSVQAAPQYRFAEISSTGTRAARCLKRGCVVFIGTVISVGSEVNKDSVPPISAALVRDIGFRVDEWLYGKRPEDGGETVLSFVSKPQLQRWDVTEEGSWSGWVNINPVVGQRLLVFQFTDAAVKMLGWRQWETVAQACASSEPDYALLRHVVSRHIAFEKTPSDVGRAPTELRGQMDPVFAAYFLNYVFDQLQDNNIRQIALAGVAGDPVIPTSVSVDCVLRLQTEIISEDARRKVIERLTVLALSDDRSLSVAALVRLSTANSETVGRVLESTGTRESLERRYRFLIGTGDIEARNIRFESVIGFERD